MVDFVVVVIELDDSMGRLVSSSTTGLALPHCHFEVFAIILFMRHHGTGYPEGHVPFTGVELITVAEVANMMSNI